jgi:imidazolonepropionase-like amidohydrolase
MGVAWVFRKAFYETLRLEAGPSIGGADTPSAASIVVLQQVLSGELPLRIRARKQHDILSALRLTEEFGLALTLTEATESYLCLDELRARQIPVIFGPLYVDPPGMRRFSVETDKPRLHTIRALHDAGIETALTAQELRGEDGLARQAMYAMRCGLTFDEALNLVTTAPAKLLGLEDEIGTIAAGKWADLVVWSGQPFEAVSRPVVVVVGGEVVVDARGL